MGVVRRRSIKIKRKDLTNIKAAFCPESEPRDILNYDTGIEADGNIESEDK